MHSTFKPSNLQTFEQGLKKRKNWKAAIQLVHYMRSRGIVPDTVTYTAALSACERKANATTALALLALMKVNT